MLFEGRFEGRMLCDCLLFEGGYGSYVLFVFEGPEEGRMFSPCLCRGSMQLVHVACLNQWRRSSANPRSYYQCEQCNYRYQLRRAWFAEILLDGRFVTLCSVMVRT